MAVELPENDEEGPEKESLQVNFTSQQLQQLPQRFMTETILK